MLVKTALTAAVAALLLATTAQAQTEAAAWTDLNLRAGPGPMYPILGVIPAAGIVAVEGCLDAATWCKVSHEGMQGWASGDYLTAMVDDAPVVVYTNRDKVKVGSVTYEDTTGGSIAAGGAAGAVAGAIVGGPVGALIGAVVGGSAVAIADPGQTVRTYVTANPVEPIYLDGEVVVGAGIPETVMLSEVPDSEYSYAYVNGVPVIVDRSKRSVVYIVR